MTRRDFTIKWAHYALCLLPVWWLECFVLNRVPVFGVFPLLLPLAAVAVAVLEGPASGAGFGLAVGILCDCVYFGTGGVMTLGLTLIGWAAGAAAQYVLDRNYFGFLLCSAAALAAIGGGRVFLRMFLGVADLPALLAVAVPEALWSLCFTVVIYPWFSFFHRRIVKKLRL